MRRFGMFAVTLFLCVSCACLPACSAMRDISGSDKLSDQKISEQKMSQEKSQPQKQQSAPKEVTPKEIIPTDNPATVAKRFVENLVRGDIAKARDDCSAALAFNNVVESYDQCSSSLGKFIEAGDVSETTRTSGGASIPVVTVNAAFEDESLMFSLEFDSGRITNVWMDRYGGY